MKKYDIVALGEALIDFTPGGLSEHGYPVYAQNPGGAVLNVAATAAKMGKKSALIAKTGDDLFGAFLRVELSKLGVDVSPMVTDPDRNTTLAFVSLKEDGERDFAFYRKNNADVTLSKEDLDLRILSDTEIFHFGGLSLVNPSYTEATVEAVSAAKKAGAFISYDPNDRPPLWDSREKARNSMTAVLPMVDLMKISFDEARFLLGKETIDDCFDVLLGAGIQLATITDGANGAYYATPKQRGFFPAEKVASIDSTGAGDIFWGTFLCEWLDLRPEDGDRETLEAIGHRASKAAAISTTRTGAVPSIPSPDEL